MDKANNKITDENHTDYGEIMMYRVFKGTVQRVSLTIKSLNSHGIFIILLLNEKQLINWVGCHCDSGDIDLAREISNSIIMKDFHIKDHNNDVPTIYENNEPNHLLEIVLDLLYSSSTSYFSKINALERKSKLTNNSVSVGLIEKISLDGTNAEYDYQETGFAHPDNLGTVPRVTFVPIEVDTVAYVNIGDHWDLWIARGVSKEEESNIIEYITKSLIEQLNLENSSYKKDIVNQYLKIVRQGEEKTLFRRPLKIFTDFEPIGKTLPRPEPLPKVKKEKKDKKSKNKKSAFDIDEENEKQQEEEERKRQDDDRYNDSNVVDFWAQPNKDNDHNTSLLNLGDLARYVESSKKSGSDVKLTGTDINTITPGMVQIVEDYNLNPEQRRAVIDDAAHNPSSLIGYQVEIDEGVYAGVFVVTKVKKTALFKKTLFYLAGLDGDEFWVRLRRGKKAGERFRPLRRVVDPQHIDYSKQCGKGTKEKKKKNIEEAADNTAAQQGLLDGDSDNTSNNDNNSSDENVRAAMSAEQGNDFEENDQLLLQ